MRILSAAAQLGTTDLDRAIAFYTGKLGLSLAFRYEDFYAGIQAGTQIFHLKLVDDPDPRIAAVSAYDGFHLYLETDDAAAAAETFRRNGVAFVRDLEDKPWGMREFVVTDDDGHILYFGERR
jgi:catechol 2,3-dioxygenase-like lactoylglutathione lyase family enzyme